MAGQAAKGQRQAAKGEGRKLAATLLAGKREAVVESPSATILHHACGTMETETAFPQLPESEARRAPECDGGNGSVDGDATR